MKKTERIDFRILVLFFFCSLLGYVHFFINSSKDLSHDWRYFNSLSLLVRSIVWRFKTFPLHDPWVFGGMDLLSNPQNRVFSPFILFDLIFTPQWAGVASLVVYGFFGLLGMFRLLKFFEISSEASAVGAILFVNSSWFGLHFAEGHIPYGSMLLLPWVFYFILNLEKTKSFLSFFLLMSLFILDGGIYTFIFSGFVLLGLFGFGIKNPFQTVSSLAREKIKYTCGPIAIFVFLSIPKLWPLLKFHRNRQPTLESLEIPLASLRDVFFNSALSPLEQTPFSYLHWQEFGCYLSKLGFALAVLGVITGTAKISRIRYVLLLAFWFWTATGLFGQYNPWELFQKIPLLSNAHVQSRLLILCFLIFSIFLASGFDRLFQHLKKLGGIYLNLIWIVALFLIIESFQVRNAPIKEMFAHASYSKFPTLIEHGLKYPTADKIEKPMLYFSEKSAADTYEPAWFESGVRSNTYSNYRGEIYTVQGLVSLSDFVVTPGKIQFSYSGFNSSVIEINQNYLDHWRADPSWASVEKSAGGLIQVSVPPGKGVLILHYAPTYFKWIILSFVLGVVLLGYLILSLRKSDVASRFDYSQIPVGFYDEVLREGGAIRRCWHHLKFSRIIEFLPEKANQSILDIGCFSGTFLSLLSKESFSRQVGADILPSQIEYAKEKYQTDYREFYSIERISDISSIVGSFDYISLIEVIEHLDQAEIKSLFLAARQKLNAGGYFILTTPNYFSFWPIIEYALERFSDVTYEEQHITRFNYFNLVSRLRKIYPQFDDEFSVEFKATSHFIAPFLALFSESFALRASRLVSHKKWVFPFGNLIILVLKAKK